MKAVVIGGSGLVGGYLLKYLFSETRVTEVISVVRRPLIQYANEPKYKEVVYDFKSWNQLKTILATHHLTENDSAYCCLGTTIKKAGSQEAFRQVDHDHILHFAEATKTSGVGNFLVVSAMGANPDSKIFYNQVKGETERDLKKMGFKSLKIFQPSLLLGDRQEKRAGEKLAVELLPFYSPLLKGPLKKYHPIPAEKVARAMTHASLQGHPGLEIIDNPSMLSN